MISYKPQSILQLTIIGFLMVAGILIVTLIITARQLDGLSEQSQRMISQSAEAMRVSRSLLEQVGAMERNARQYSVVEDRAMLAIYEERRRNFMTSSEQLRALHLYDGMNGLIDELVNNEVLAYEQLTSDNPMNSLELFYPQLIGDANQISQRVNAWINSQLESIRLETAQTKRLLTIQSVVLVSIALILAGIFTVLISAPLLQIEKAIKLLGAGLYSPPIKVTGPRDLVSLGERLNWLRERLAKLEQQRSSFLRHVSHELKTPLAAMQESASLLHDGVVGELNAEQQEILRIQSSNCQRLQTLIDELLRHNSENFSVLNAMPQEVRLDKLLENVTAAHELGIKNKQLVTELKLQKLSVSGHAEQLRVVIDNLVVNAIRFSPKGGTLKLCLARNEGVIEMDIIDEGPGIPADEADKIFEAFYQGRPASDGKLEGSGLGLAIAQEYAGANGAVIEVMDTAGKGAHFRVRFPASAPQTTRDTA